MKNKSIYFSLFLIIAFANFSDAQNVVKNKNLPNLYKVNDNLYRGGQPTEFGISQLKALNIKTVIDLRGADERAEKEEKWVSNSGMKFINLPMRNWLEPKDAQIEEVLAEINNAENQPVFVHCKRGSDRTGTVVAVYRMTHDNWTAQQANDEAKGFGFGWWQVWMKDYINDYHRDIKQPN